MKNYLLTLSYAGTNYHGWQIQANADTVQQRLQYAAVEIFGFRPDFKGCSRTDSGVHARMFCCSFRADLNIPTGKIPAALNSKLPGDIIVSDAAEVPYDFHARYSCTGKEYEYIIQNSRFPDPFTAPFSWHIRQNLNVEKMNEAAKAFIGEHDFSAYCASGDSVESHIRRIYNSEVLRDGDKVIFRISGNGFLYNMVRIMTGTLIYVSEGKILPSEIPDITQSLDRFRAGPTAPPQGLFLNKVFYERSDVDD